MNYLDKYLEYRDELWEEFERTVRKGAELDIITAVYYPRGVKVRGLPTNTEGQRWFYAKEIIANPEYNLHIGKDLIVGTGKVTFVDAEDGRKHTLEPDILDTYWICELLDNRKL